MKEYRIGNIIQFAEINIKGRLDKPPFDPTIHLAKVCEIHPDMIEVVDAEGNRVELKEAQPVELTCTILIECGFSETEKRYYKNIGELGCSLVYSIKR